MKNQLTLSIWIMVIFLTIGLLSIHNIPLLVVLWLYGIPLAFCTKWENESDLDILEQILFIIGAICPVLNVMVFIELGKEKLSYNIQQEI